MVTTWSLLGHLVTDQPTHYIRGLVTTGYCGMENNILIKRLTGSDRQRGDCDFTMSRKIAENEWWEFNIYRRQIKKAYHESSSSPVTNSQDHLYKDDSSALYHILESGGCSSIALLYFNDYVTPRPFLQNSDLIINDFPHLSHKAIIARLIAFTIYKPHFLTWC